jgi:hypothetical protein
MGPILEISIGEYMAMKNPFRKRYRVVTSHRVNNYNSFSPMPGGKRFFTQGSAVSYKLYLDKALNSTYNWNYVQRL